MDVGSGVGVAVGCGVAVAVGSEVALGVSVGRGVAVGAGAGEASAWADSEGRRLSISAVCCLSSIFLFTIKIMTAAKQIVEIIDSIMDKIFLYFFIFLLYVRKFGQCNCFT